MSQRGGKASGVSVCVSCLDEGVVFNCKGEGGMCLYKLCASCIRLSFDDTSGASSSFCPMCRTPSALEMIGAVCGKGAIIAIEEKLREKVEFQCQAENKRKEASRINANEITVRARRIYNDLANKLNLRCPRCETAFHDYDGCNALRCATPLCQAAFCAICLKDCGRDAHEHVRGAHQGGMYDKNAFHTSTKIRTQEQIGILMNSLAHESFELRQLVMNHIEKAKLMDESTNVSTRTTTFLEKTKAYLFLAVGSDRLAILSDSIDYRRERLTREHISPRCIVPNQYRLSLNHIEKDVYRIRLEMNILPGENHWIQINDIEAHFNENPKIESLVNVSQALRCAVIAFDGETTLYQSSRSAGRKVANDEVCIRLQAIDHHGHIMDDDGVHRNHSVHMNIIGLNQNMRMLELERYVKETPASELMFEPLQHLIGLNTPKPLIFDMEMEAPTSYLDLNEDQKKVAHPLFLRTAMEIAGPPGTGKTKTIVELVRGILQCTRYDVLVLSERNGAINAVAEKFKNESININAKKIIDLDVWQSVMTYGAGDTMGDCTKLFTLEEKLKYHPELVSLQERRAMLTAASKNLTEALRIKVSEIVQCFGCHFNENSAAIRSKAIMTDPDLSSPHCVIDAVVLATEDIKNLLERTAEKGSKYVFEQDVSNVIIRHSTLLGRLVYILTDSERHNKNSAPWDAKEATKRLRYILDKFSKVLKLDIFSLDNAQSLYKEKAAVDEEYKVVHNRLKSLLPAIARLRMSTIGSSHRVFVREEKDSDDDLNQNFERIMLSDVDEVDPPTETICIFDEAGCIPAYELLGLTRLRMPIKAVIIVGDKHQLPPYDPMQGRSFHRGDSLGNIASRGRRDSLGNIASRGRRNMDERMQSLIDVSALTIDSGKAMLKTQYRVPRDIAEILNSRVYRGSYKTCPNARVQMSGLKMVNVPYAESPRKKYVNPNEIREGIKLVHKLNSDYEISNILVITPYKNQQREFEFEWKTQKHTSEITFLTIDQCQGQEADAVILSLVRRPTRFLTLNRFNVALSRVRKRLYVLTDFKDLQDACRDTDWDSAYLAADLLMHVT